MQIMQNVQTMQGIETMQTMQTMQVMQKCRKLRVSFPKTALKRPRWPIRRPVVGWRCKQPSPSQSASRPVPPLPHAVEARSNRQVRWLAL